MLRIHIFNNSLPPAFQLLESLLFGDIVDINNSKGVAKKRREHRLIMCFSSNVPAHQTKECLLFIKWSPKLALRQLSSDGGVGELGEWAPAEPIFDIGFACVDFSHNCNFDLKLWLFSLKHIINSYMAENNDSTIFDHYVVSLWFRSSSPDNNPCAASTPIASLSLTPSQSFISKLLNKARAVT